jgi:ubiquinone/menaquinone biosynthesis C-methylase UbiE
MLNDYDAMGEVYSKHSITGTSYLAFKNIPTLIKKYVNGKNTLDFGCGSGRSTRFLDSLGMHVVGVDINESMLQLAKKENYKRYIDYKLIDKGKVPYGNQTFDFVFSGLVLFGISSIDGLVSIFNEIHRVIKKDGVFIAVTGSTAQYENNWYSLKTDFPENKQLKSGDIAKVVLSNIGLEVFDYYWTESDYDKVVTESGFKTLEKNHPLGDINDGYDWISETKISPYITYVMRPRNE